MSYEIKCPHCGKVFQVDEAEYASIANQVKNKEFDAELERRIEELHKRSETEKELVKAQAEQEFQKQLGKKEEEIQLKLTEINALKNQLDGAEAQKQVELTKALAAKDQEIAELNLAIAQSDSKLKLAVMQEKTNAQEMFQKKDQEIAKLRIEKEQQQRESREKEDNLKEQYGKEIKSMQELVDYYKEYKTRLTTKMVGESLEEHCSTQFEQYIRPILPSATFGKDNEIVEGTKADFIFHDFADGLDYLSIIFEMKNESDTKSVKHKNDDFLKKLDEDRRKKGCEYAVLVSMLEPDNDYYNNGIVSKEHMYPKMYVIRPQFFVPMIQLLVGMAKNNLEDKKKLQIALERDVDVTDFEGKLDEFKRKFGKHVTWYNGSLTDALNKIDATIEQLQAVKDSLVLAGDHLDDAQKNLELLDIDKMTKKNPTMKAKFEEARKVAAESVKEITD